MSADAFVPPDFAVPIVLASTARRSCCRRCASLSVPIPQLTDILSVYAGLQDARQASLLDKRCFCTLPSALRGN